MRDSRKIDEVKTKAVRVLKRYPIRKAGLFGSIVRGEDNLDSDIDLLIEVEENARFSLLDLVKVKLDLEDELEKEVDLVQYHLIKPALKEFILPDEVRIYEKGD